MGSKVRLELKHYQKQFVLRGDSKKELSERTCQKTLLNMDRIKKKNQKGQCMDKNY